METHDCSCWQNDGADSVSHCDLPFAHTEIWSPSLNPSSPIMKSSTECYVSACASEEKALHHPDLHCVLLVLSRWNLEDAIDEVIENVFSERFIKNRLSGGLSHWSTKDVKEWLLSLKLLSAYHDQLTLQVDHECIDGEALVELVCEHRLREVLQIDYVSDLILELIVSAWRTVSRDFALPKTLPISLIGVRTGYVCDLSSCSTEEATKMMEVNKSCAQCGMGGLYGQLVVLGYSEYRIVGDKWFSFGHANKTFPLIRR